ncbi:MAG TPA: rhombotarget lipoprotein [Mariprofundaceae bacterium]|nr:rhombotarget lipoprotein [Mariprofundaceae bacterium]
MRFEVRLFSLILVAAILGSCATAFWNTEYKRREASSVVDYLYPKGEPAAAEMVTHITLPVKVGIAFVPDGRGGISTSLSEEKKMALLKQVKDVFEKYEYVQKIEIIPSAYLRPGGGFDNLQQLSSMFGVDVMALVSYDQIQFDDPNALSFLYWTIVGAYVVKGDQHDTQTMVDASVFDIHSKKLLFRAPGTSMIKGTATAMKYQEIARAGREEGYAKAVGEMIPNLEKEMAAFKERIKGDASVQIHHRQGSSGGGSFSMPALMATACFALLIAFRRR